MVVRVSARGGQHTALQNEDAVRYVFRELSVSYIIFVSFIIFT